MWFYNLGKWIYRHKWLVIGVWTVVLVASLPFVPRVIEPLKTGGFADPALESSKAADLLQKKLGYSTSSLVIFYQSPPQMTAYDPEFARQVEASLVELQKSPVKNSIVLPSVNPRQVSKDGHTAYALVTFEADGELVTKRLPEIRPLIKQPPSLKMTIGGGLAFYEDVEVVSQRDLERAELVAFPVAIVALVLAFGSVVAGCLPVAVGGVGVAIILCLLFWLGHLTEISIFAVNLATLLGLGLGLDYSLFLTSRFREELARGRSTEEAVGVTLATAGKAVTFSGLTVMIGLSGTLLFKINILTSVGLAGFIVVIVSVLAAITLLPAILTLLGTRVNALSVSKLLRRPARPIIANSDQHGFWAWLAHLVMKRPVTIFVAVLAVLVVLGLPFLQVKFSSPDASILPTDVPSRQAFDILKSNFNETEITPILIAVKAPNNGSILASDNVYYLYDFAKAVAQDPRVERVDSIVSVEPRLTKSQYQFFYTAPDKIQDLILQTFLKAYANQDTTLITVVLKSQYGSTSQEAKDLVQKLRNSQIGNGLTLQVTGATAGIMDVVSGIYDTFPLAATVIVLTTYFILLILLRSIVLPLKAILMNALSILASYGALVWVFQEGNLSNVLNFKPLGLIEPSLPIIMFCTLFGLSMDYEVFLLSRIKENFEHTGDNTASVALGLQKSGKIITSAALIVVLVCLSFVTADIVLVKALGLGVAVAVGLDATIVRALLVPATMRLLGDWNWYAPKWVLRILPYTRLETEMFDQADITPPPLSKQPAA